nr:MAG TPA: putative tail component [Caudoviricetes sp.]
MEIEVVDHSGEIGKELRAALLRSLERCGSEAEGYAKDLAPYDTNRLKNSITHQVNDDEMSVIIGTDVEYGVYQELGTGIYAEGGGG